MTDVPIRLAVWAPTRETPPRRSRLYSLEPIGIGTPEVESLSSYLNRLAQAHCVTVTTLLVHELLPRVGTPASSRAHPASTPPRGGGRGLSQHLARQLNGLGRIAAAWVHGLEVLTGRRDLRFLTLLTWQAVLPTRHLFAPRIRWCPACFEDQQTAGHPLYLPLVWTLNPVTICVRHRQPLQSHCPDCHRPLVAFSGRSRPGYCSRCGAWLGTAARVALPPVAPQAADPWAAWVGTTLGHLLQAAPRLERPPPRDTVARAFTAYHAHPAAAGTPPSTMAFGRQRVRSSRWVQGERLMQIDLLLRFCWQRDLSLVQFLTAPPPVRVSPGAVAQPPRAVPDRATAPGPRTVSRRETVCDALEAALTTTGPPVSLRAVAQRLQIETRTLWTYAPDLCQHLVDRRTVALAQQRNQLQTLLEDALREDPPPVLQRVCQRGAVLTSKAWYHYPELCRQIVARAAEERQQRFLRLQQAVEQAVHEEAPPPTLKAVAARLGRSANSLRQYFPALCHQLTARHHAYQQVCLQQRHHACVEEIRTIALALHAQGIFPSINRVAEQLARPRNIASNAAYIAALRQLRQELGWKQ
jgi:TniQ